MFFIKLNLFKINHLSFHLTICVFMFLVIKIFFLFLNPLLTARNLILVFGLFFLFCFHFNMLT